MPQGLQVWDANGVLTLDITTRLTRLVGSITTGVVDGSYTIPFETGSPFIVVMDNSQIYTRRGPGVWLEGYIIRWAFSTSPRAPTPRVSYTIKYGYY